MLQVNLGIIDENPSTISGTISIMEHLQKLVPVKHDGQFHVIPCHGDGLSVERMTDAKRARAADLTPAKRLDGLYQVPQEFHHRGLMLQVCVITLSIKITKKIYHLFCLMYIMCQTHDILCINKIDK